MDEQKNPVNISPEVFAKLPGFVLISGIVETGSIDAPAIKTYLTEAWEGLKQKLADENSPESLRIKHWVEALKASGIKTKDFPPSIHAIAKRALKGGEVFSVNPIVDAYNAISMELALPLGAYDAEQMQGHYLRLSQGGEEFLAIGSQENDPTLPGEIVYSDDNTILTRMFIWRQSDKAKITAETKKFIFVCELLDTMGPDMASKAQNLIEEKMKALLGANITNLSIQAHQQ